MTEHSNLIGGSSADRRINCPGSYKAELPYANKSTEFTEMGTACHEAMEHILLEDCDPTDVIGMTFNKDNPIQPEGFTITDEYDGLFTTKIVPAHDAWIQIMEKYGEIDFTVEAKCDLSDIIDGAFGTVDILGQLVDEPTTKIVADWKFGSQIVTPYSNYQCGFYAAAAKHTKNDPDIVEIMAGAEKIIFIIIQPDNGECHWLDWETNVKWVDMFTELTVNAVNQAKSDDAPIKPGAHCKWCSHKPDCETQKEAVIEALQVDPANTTPIERAYWLNKADQLSAWVSALRKIAHEDLERGVAIPGWKHVEKRATRKFVGVEEDELTRILGSVIGDENTHNAPKIKSPTQVETELKKQYSAKVKEGTAKRGEWKSVYESEIAPHVSKVSSGTKLAPDSDPAPAVTDTIDLLAKALASVKAPKEGAH